VSPFSQWTWNWDPGAIFTSSPGGSAVHMCLFAQVKYPGGILGVPATNYPTNSDPNTRQNAQHNIDVVDIVYPLRAPRNGERFFGFAIPNPKQTALRGRIVVEAITDARRQAMLAAAAPRLKKLFGRGKLQAPSQAGLVLGKERLFVRGELEDDGSTKRRRKIDPCKEALRAARFGHTGELTRDTFSQLAEGKLGKEQAVTLAPEEVRQGMLHIVPPPQMKAGDMMVLDVRHEVPGPDKKKPTVVGGLLVVVRAVKASRKGYGAGDGAPVGRAT
jgi:hypothetical protein